MGEQKVVRDLNGFGAVLDARCVHTHRMSQEGGDPRLVMGDPKRNPVAKPLE